MALDVALSMCVDCRRNACRATGASQAPAPDASCSWVTAMVKASVKRWARTTRRRGASSALHARQRSSGVSTRSRRTCCCRSRIRRSSTPRNAPRSSSCRSCRCVASAIRAVGGAAPFSPQCSIWTGRVRGRHIRRVSPDTLESERGRARRLRRNWLPHARDYTRRPRSGAGSCLRRRSIYMYRLCHVLVNRPPWRDENRLGLQGVRRPVSPPKRPKPLCL